jgi:hypothetical protein
MTRRLVASLCLVVGVTLSLSACGNARKTLGLEKKAPDEFAVVARAPLALPPDFALRPPEPGKERPQENNPTDQARNVVLGNSAASSAGFTVGGFGNSGFGSNSPAQLSPGQQSLLQAAGADKAAPDIRQTVNRESSALAEESKSFTDSLVFWRDADPTGTVVDAEKEAQRIRNNQALGSPVTEGETPQIERREKGMLEGIF